MALVGVGQRVRSRRSCSRSGSSSCGSGCGGGSGGPKERREGSWEGREEEDAVGRRSVSCGPPADADAGVSALPVTHRPCPLPPPSMCRPSPSLLLVLSSPSSLDGRVLILVVVGSRRRCRCRCSGGSDGASIAACTGEAMVVVVISVCDTGGLRLHDTMAWHRRERQAKHRTAPGRHRM